MVEHDFTPIIWNFPTGADIKVFPVSCVHVGAREALLKKFELFIAMVKKEPRLYVVLLGDLMNNALKNSVSNVYEDVMRPREQKQWLINNLGEILDRILCIVPGNHENRSDKEVDNNPLYDVCAKLGIADKFRSNAAFMFLRFGNINSCGTTNPSYSVCALHGSGGGILTGGIVNRNERFACVVDGLDLLVVGHSHKGVITKPQKIVLDPRNKKVSFRPFTVVSATSWVEYGGYALRKQLLPSSQVLQEIHISGSTKQIKALM